MFNFMRKRRLRFQDAEITLALARDRVRDEEIGAVDGYAFDIIAASDGGCTGYVTVRIVESPALYYLGHIGYRIHPAWRGHGYAFKAVSMLIPFLKDLGFGSVVITTDVDNVPSRKTCEHLLCTLESIVPVPQEYRQLCGGSTQKCRYILLTGERDR